MSNTSQGRRAAIGYSKEAIIVSIANVLLRLRGLVLLPFISKLMGAEAYGIWIQLLAAISLFTNSFEMSLNIALIRYIAGLNDRDQIGEVFWTIFLLAIAFCSLGAIAMLGAADILSAFFLGVPGTATIFRAGALIVLLEGINIQSLSFFRATKRMRTYSLFLISRMLLQLVFVLVSLLVTRNLVLMAWAMAGGQLLMGLVMLIPILRRVGWHKPRLGQVGEYLRYSFPLVPAEIANWLVNKGERFVIGYFLGAAAVGVYSAAYSIGVLPMIIVRTMRQVLFPRVTNLWEHKDIKGVKRYLGYSLRYLWMLIVPLSFGLSAFAGHLLQKLATEEFARPGELVVPIVATGIVCLGLDHVFRQVLFIVKNTKLILYVTIITGSLNILLAVLLVPNFGLASAAFASLMCFLCSAILVIYSSRQYITFSVDLVGLIKSILAACAMTGIIILSSPQGLWQLAGSGVLGAMVYFGVLFLIRGFSPKEIEFFKALFASLIAFPWRRLSKESQ